MPEIVVGSHLGQQDFGFRFGKPELTEVTVVVKSLVQGDVTVTLSNGDIKVIPLGAAQAIGTDAPVGHPYNGLQAGFVNNAIFTNLEAATVYTCSATQGLTTYTGKTNTAPNFNDDYLKFDLSCDNNGSTMVALPVLSPGGYGHIRKLCEENPNKLVYMVHIDDHYGYLARTGIDDSAPGGTGHITTNGAIFASTNGNEYDYCIAAFNAFGLYSDVAISTNVSATSNQSLWGKHEDYIWCMRHVPILPQWGDWDTGINEMGWEIDPANNVDLVAATGKTGKQLFDNCTAVWREFLTPFQGEPIDAGNSNAWSHTLGCLKIIAPDGISKGSGDGKTGFSGPAGVLWDRPTTIWGDTQIANIVASCDDNTVPFKNMLMNYAMRSYYDSPTSVDSQVTGSQNPIAGNPSFVNGMQSALVAHSDYQKLFTSATGIMSKDTCNGVGGVFWTFHGDDHRGVVARHRGTEGVLDEWFWSITAGTITGSANFLNNGSYPLVGTTIDGSELKLILGAGAGDSEFIRNYFVCASFIYGSRPLKEIEIELYERGGRLVWNKKVVESRGGNDFHDIDSDLFGTGSSGSSV